MPFYFADAAGLEIRWCGVWWVCESSVPAVVYQIYIKQARPVNELQEDTYWTHSKLIVFAVFVFSDIYVYIISIFVIWSEEFLWLLSIIYPQSITSLVDAFSLVFFHSCCGIVSLGLLENITVIIYKLNENIELVL